MTTPTLAALRVLPLSAKPFCVTTATVLFSLSGTGSWKSASWRLGSNLSPAAGSTRVKPCLPKTDEDRKGVEKEIDLVLIDARIDGDEEVLKLATESFLAVFEKEKEMITR